MKAEALDSRRRNDAAKRVAAALRDAEYHERQAALYRARAESLARVWEIPLCDVSHTEEP